MGSFPVRLEDAPAQVSLFAYDNNSFVAQSFLDAPVTVSVSVAGTTRTITDLVSGQTLSRAPAPARGAARRGFGGGGGGRRGGAGAPESSYSITIPPHSYRAFTAQN
jgi:hypothetical protein